MAPDEIQQLLSAGRWSYSRWRGPRQSRHLLPGKYAATQRLLLPLGGHLVQQAAPGSRPPAAPIWVGRRDEQHRLHHARVAFVRAQLEQPSDQRTVVPNRRRPQVGQQQHRVAGLSRNGCQVGRTRELHGD